MAKFAPYDLTDRTIFLTGATGFIGSHLLKRLIKEGCDVHIAIRQNSSLWRIREFKSNFTIHKIDLSDFDALNSIIQQIKPEIIFNLAAYGVDYRQQDMQQIINTNIINSANLFEAFLANNGHRFIHTGSCFEYGQKNKPISEYDCLDPTSVYGATKASSVYLLSNMAKGMQSEKLITLRPFGVFGEYEGLHRFVPQAIDKLKNGHPMQMTPGEQIRDYIYIDDLIDAYILASTVPLTNKTEIINIGSGKGITMKKFAFMISNHLGASDGLLQFGALPYRPNEMMYLVANVNKAKSLLGWEPKTSIEKGLEHTINWYNQNLPDLNHYLK
ncbi:NAD(P)-dependent oxidoreductase [Methanolobus sp. ZRKC2]|uniref:NAD-dependent epimerase/dehydratase family protein n=1 Tax=Methanolobus sp. ZRKC2 TaxID=3125783 RepID=UPI0032527E35